MRIFLTGATGYIGSRVAQVAIAAGHEIVGLARSNESAEKLKAAGVTPFVGSLEELDSLKKGAADADGVIHTGFSVNFEALAQSFATEKAAVEAMLSVLEGTGKPLVYTSGAGVFAETGDKIVIESDAPNATGDVGLRIPIEESVVKAAEKNIRTSVIRPGLVHGHGASQIMQALGGLVMQAGAAHTVGDGLNVWSSVHVDDLADLYVKALENSPAGSIFHAVTDDEVSMLDVASSIAKTLKLDGPAIVWPVEAAAAALGPLAAGLASNKRLSATKTREVLGWAPKSMGLIEDIESGSYPAAYAAMAEAMAAAAATEA